MAAAARSEAAWHQSLLTAKEGNSITTTTLLVKGSLYYIKPFFCLPMKYCCHHFPPRYSLMREIWGNLTASVPLPISQSLCKAAQ